MDNFEGGMSPFGLTGEDGPAPVVCGSRDAGEAGRTIPAGVAGDRGRVERVGEVGLIARATTAGEAGRGIPPYRSPGPGDPARGTPLVSRATAGICATSGFAGVGGWAIVVVRRNLSST